jgi:hypothetical protein
MLVIAAAARAAAALCAVALLAAGCSGDDDPAPDTRIIEVTTMRGALLQAADVGPTWSVPAEAPSPDLLVSLCGGESTVPAVPPGATVVASPLVDEGEKGAQTLTQIGLVYADAAAARAGLAELRTIADACPPSVDVPAKTGERQEPAYTETVDTAPLDEPPWSGFVITRHKTYGARTPAAADTAVAVLVQRNVVLVDAYAIYRLGAASANPQFDSDWKKLVGTVLNRMKS